MVLIIASMSRAVMTEEMAEGEKEEKKTKNRSVQKVAKKKTSEKHMFKLPDFVYIACTLGMKHNIKVESYTQNTNTHRHPHTKPFIKTQAYHRTA